MAPRSCVAPPGRFVFGVHKPAFRVTNLREGETISVLGARENGTLVENSRNFPAGDPDVPDGGWVFEIANPFPFRGSTFILKDWADEKAAAPRTIGLPTPPATSLHQALRDTLGNDLDPKTQDRIMAGLPTALLVALSTSSTDPDDLISLAEMSCSLLHAPETGRPTGLRYRPDDKGRIGPVIHDQPLFEAVVNNPALPDDYKVAMVLRPGAQGDSEIVGETREDHDSHVYEYLRRNSYIPGGHYASNMAEDTVRYSTGDLTAADLAGLRQLYYQRTFVRLARELGLPLPTDRRTLSPQELETLRRNILDALAAAPPTALSLTATLWGWNYGFDFAPSLYRLHASHQQIHTQYAMLPPTVSNGNGATVLPSYGCGDLVADHCRAYRQETGRPFFADYIQAIHANTRTDGQPAGEASLIVWQDEHVMLFVPKAQTSQWELQLLPLEPVGNILEADSAVRHSLDRGLLTAQKVFAVLGARMVTTIEFPKRFDSTDTDQRLLYSLLPRLPESPGAMSEAQLRWINGHYPEDFASACRASLPA